MSQGNGQQKPALREWGVHKVKVEEVKTTSWNNKESLVFVLADANGRYIDAKFSKPLSDISKKQVISLMTAAGCKGGKPSDTQGKELITFVAPNEYYDERRGQTRVFWNPRSFFSKDFEKYLGKDFGQMGKSPDDEDIFGLDEQKPAGNAGVGVDDDIRF